MKNVSLEIATTLEPLDPAAITDALAAADELLHELMPRRGDWVTNPETLTATQPQKRYLREVTDFRYIHFARAVAKTSFQGAGSEILKFVWAKDPDLRIEGQIGQTDIESDVNAELAARLGICSVEGTKHSFDEVGFVAPVRIGEERTIIALHHLAQLSDERSVALLDTVTEVTTERVRREFPEVFKIGGITLDYEEEEPEHPLTVVRTVPIASTSLMDEVSHAIIKRTLREHLMDPTVDFIASGFDISHES